MSAELLNAVAFIAILGAGVWGTSFLLGYLDRRAIRKAGK